MSTIAQYEPLQSQAALAEADRCLFCFDAPCAFACPTHIDVPRFIKKIASGNLMGSASTILDANVLGLSCSRVCPVDVLCEGACVMHNLHQRPIAIGKLQRHAMESFYAAGGSLPVSSVALPWKVACIGAGPASLACAAELRAQGAAAVVFDRRDEPGGLNTYGVAPYKLTPEESAREVELVRASGVEFRNNVEVGKDISLDDLVREYDAIFLGAGLGGTQPLSIPGEHLGGIHMALDFIAGYKKRRPVSVGERVVVIGGGNTAIDAAIAARHLGAREVTILYRRSERDMSAFAFEYQHAKQEGVRFLWNARPIAFRGADVVEAIECESIPPIDCNTAIVAIGQGRLLNLLSSIEGLRLHGGLIEIDAETGQTGNPKFFAGGDCVNGGREVVDAVAAGKRAARGIVKWLT
jgi:dihydropyrimidine dehydrogenase (NAD+) subunit PreT